MNEIIKLMKQKIRTEKDLKNFAIECAKNNMIIGWTTYIVYDSNSRVYKMIFNEVKEWK